MPTHPNRQPVPLRTIQTTIRLTVDEVADAVEKAMRVQCNE